MPKLRTSSKSTSQKQKDNSEEAGDEIAEQLDRAVRSDNSQRKKKVSVPTDSVAQTKAKFR